MLYMYTHVSLILQQNVNINNKIHNINILVNVYR